MPHNLEKLTYGISELLDTLGLKGSVVTVSRDVLEVRLSKDDAFGSAFPLKERPQVRLHAEPILPDRKPKKKEEKPPEQGFFKVASTDPMNSCGLDEEQREALYALVNGKYPFLSKTKTDSRTWECTCREIVWIAEGLFWKSHRWDPAWLGRMTKKGVGPQLMSGLATGAHAVIRAISDSLDAVVERNKEGFWWPSVEKGRQKREPLLSFLVSRTRKGTEWSPFCEIFWERNKAESISSGLPERVVDVAHRIMDESPWLSSLPKHSQDSYWEGVKKYYEWYLANRESLMKSTRNRAKLSDSGSAMELVYQWDSENGHRKVSARFVHPGVDLWGPFKAWCKDARGITI